MNPAGSDLLSSRWSILQQGQTLHTPSKEKSFEISSIAPDKITIKTQGGTEIEIRRRAFLATLSFLSENNHIASSKVKIGSNKDITKAGPLCIAARNANGPNVMVITYIIPILSKIGLVGIDDNRPNRTWLI